MRREIVLPSGTPASPRPGFTGEAHIVEWRADRVTVDARLSGPGYVVLVEGFDPGWRATVDGTPAEVQRANLGFRAVAAGAGGHRVVFTYRPLSALMGLAISMAAVITCAAILVWPRRAAPLAGGSA
jgi:uncharacterized membrane protein YfhO